MTEQKDNFVPDNFAGFVNQYVDLKKAEADDAIKAKEKKVREQKQETKRKGEKMLIENPRGGDLCYL